MTIKELEEFCVICRRGSLAKASKELFMSPQGLSRVIKNLENELECTLMNRTAAGLELTESGERLREYARKSLSDYEKLRGDIEKIRKSADGTVDILCAYDIIRFLTPECILDFERIYPNISVSFREYPDRVAERMLMEKKGNVAFSIGPFKKDCYNARTLKKCRLGLLVYREHPLAAKKSVSIREIKGEPLYLENGSFKLNELVKSRCWGLGFEPEIVFETSGFDLCYNMCRRKKGISVTVDFIHEDMNTNGLLMVPFEEELVWEIGLLTEKDCQVEPAVCKFCQFIENALEL